MAKEFGTGKVLFKSKGFDKAEETHKDAKSKALGKKIKVKGSDEKVGFYEKHGEAPKGTRILHGESRYPTGRFQGKKEIYSLHKEDSR